MLIESQEKKLELLDEVIKLDREQESIITGSTPDMGALDANIDAKGALIEELDKLDEGFESVYAKVRDELNNNKESHKEEIRRLQDLIRSIMEKTAEIEALENRSKINFESFIKRRRHAIKDNKSTLKVANTYAVNMRKINKVDAMFLDGKK